MSRTEEIFEQIRNLLQQAEALLVKKPKPEIHPTLVEAIDEVSEGWPNAEFSHPRGTYQWGDSNGTLVVEGDGKIKTTGRVGIIYPSRWAAIIALAQAIERGEINKEKENDVLGTT